MMKVIEHAAEGTDMVLAKVDAVLDGLRHFEGRSLNGAGVLDDPSARRAELVKAKKDIEAALAAMDAITWPSEDDYSKCDE
ncbi:hypothetical protein [Celeribacter naphthalenivorans]|uniref:hypothetical protein n=1 Tax=Celeribacter naphthalenivorans TaxID=1614694 RepID=UPI001CFA9B52|nr:hypothetical protein [Celeribacter naphthalenivorans]